MTARRIKTPHLRTGEPVLRFDLGDELARIHGLRVVPVACGRDDVLTTLVTLVEDRGRCPGCIEALAAPVVPQFEVDEHGRRVPAGEPT